MSLSCGYGRAIKFKIKRGTGIMDGGRCIAKVNRSTNGCINTVMAHGANHGNVFDVFFIKQIFKRGLTKRIVVMLSDDGFALYRLYFLVDFYTISTRRKDWCFI